MVPYKNYLRVTRPFNGREIVVGIEYWDEDNFFTIHDSVVLFVEQAIVIFQDYLDQDNKFYAKVLNNSAKRLFPLRQFFLEIGDDKDSWVQVCPAEVSYVVN